MKTKYTFLTSSRVVGCKQHVSFLNTEIAGADPGIFYLGAGGEGGPNLAAEIACVAGVGRGAPKFPLPLPLLRRLVQKVLLNFYLANYFYRDDHVFLSVNVGRRRQGKYSVC